MFNFMMFDVESVGLHGEGFAVGWVVMENGQCIAAAQYSCPTEEAKGEDSDRAWVEENVPFSPVGEQRTPFGVRYEFWRAWEYAKKKGYLLFSDCAWPVEANFLEAAYQENKDDRGDAAPYPLHDLASFLLALGYDPLASYGRLPSELPAHDPLKDARQSARVLIEAANGTLQIKE